MHLLKLGVHCGVSDCKQLDFLPFECDLCHEKFCGDHFKYEAHDCPNVYKKEYAGQIPVCPVCSQPIPLKKGEDPNAVVEAHIAQGCPKVSKTVIDMHDGDVPNCQFNKCNEKKMTTCKLCGGGFCLKHRNEHDHNCVALERKTERKMLYKKPISTTSGTSGTKPTDTGFLSMGTRAYDKVNSYLGELHRERQAEALRRDLGPPKPSGPVANPVAPQKIPSTTTTTTTASSTVSSLKQSQALQIPFANKKLQPVGQSSIDYQNKFFLDVFFPLSARLQPVHMFFHQDWPVGKVLDLVAEQGKIKNTNNRLPEAERLYLFSLKTGQRLPNNKTLKQLKQEGALSVHDSIILENGLELSQEIKDMIADKSKASEYVSSYCLLS